MARPSMWGFRFKTLDLGTPEEYFDGLQKPFKEAATETMRETGLLAKTKLRAQAKARFRNRPGKGASRFENAFGAWAYPKKGKPASFDPAATIQANASWAPIFEEGMPKEIRPAMRRFLAIPMEDAENLGLANPVGAGRFPKRASQTARARTAYHTFVTETDKGLFVTGKRGDDTLWLFKLVPIVRENSRISLRRISEEALDSMPGLFAKAMAQAQ